MSPLLMTNRFGGTSPLSPTPNEKDWLSHLQVFLDPSKSLSLWEKTTYNIWKEGAERNTDSSKRKKSCAKHSWLFFKLFQDQSSTSLQGSVQWNRDKLGVFTYWSHSARKEPGGTGKKHFPSAFPHFFFPPLSIVVPPQEGEQKWVSQFFSDPEGTPPPVLPGVPGSTWLSPAPHLSRPTAKTLRWVRAQELNQLQDWTCHLCLIF